MRKQAERLSTLSKVKSPTSGNTTLGLPFPIHSREVLPTMSQLKCQIHVLPSHPPRPRFSTSLSAIQTLQIAAFMVFFSQCFSLYPLHSPHPGLSFLLRAPNPKSFVDPMPWWIQTIWYCIQRHPRSASKPSWLFLHFLMNPAPRCPQSCLLQTNSKRLLMLSPLLLFN